MKKHFLMICSHNYSNSKCILAEWNPFVDWKPFVLLIFGKVDKVPESLRDNREKSECLARPMLVSKEYKISLVYFHFG